MTFGSLFAGIGGLDLGLERAGMTCAWQVEIDEYARRVLEKHWPNVRRHDDVRTFPPEGDWSCDLVCGGFPCQDISNAGKREGIGGPRSGLWSEFSRIIRVLRPIYIVVENVAALLNRGMDTVLKDLAEGGYDAEWSVFPCCSLGAPHTRSRVFIVANSKEQWIIQRGREQLDKDGEEERHLHNWKDQSEPSRVADGIPHRMDRLKCLGNAVVPQVAEWIGRRILEVRS